MRRSVELLYEASSSLLMMGCFLFFHTISGNVGQLTRHKLLKWHAGLIFVLLFVFAFLMNWIYHSTCQSPDIFQHQSFVSGFDVQMISCIGCLHYMYLLSGISGPMISRQIS